MSSEIEDPRALDLCAIGLGQGGGNLAAEWYRRGYRTLLFNTARSDLRALSRTEGLDLPEAFRIHIGIGGTDGAGKDPEYGAACLREHEDEVRAAVEAQLTGADAILLCAGLGGGTGSSVNELVRILEPLEHPLIAVASLPADSESGITKVNAVRTTNQLVQAPLHGRIFIDNERLVEGFPDIDLLSYYPSVNARVLGPLDALNRLNADPDLYSIRSFDGEDMRKVLLSGGVLQTHQELLDEGEALSPRLLVDVVRACVDGGQHLASGLRLDQCAYLALVVVGPERVLQKTPIHVLDEAIAALKKETGGGAVYEGLYAGKDVPLQVFVLSASLALPDRVQALLGAAHEEGGALMEKISEEIPELEISPLEGLDLFRAPTRRRSGTPAARPRPPRPRPLGAQLGDDSMVGHAVKTPPARRPVVNPTPVPARAAAKRPAPAAPAPAVTAEGGAAPPSEATEHVARKTPPPPSEATEHVERQSPPVPSEATAQVPADGAEREALVPRVGTGRYDDDDAADRLEATVARASGADIPSSAPAEVSLPEEHPAESPEATEAQPPPSAGGDLKPRVGTGRWDEEDEGALAAVEPTEMRPDAEVRTPRAPGPRTEEEELPASAGPAGDLPAPGRVKVRAGTGRPSEDDREITEAVPLSEIGPSAVKNLSSGLFSAEDLPFEYDIEGEADQFETGAALTRPVDEDAILAAVPDEFDAGEEDDTHTTGQTLSGGNPLDGAPSSIGVPTVISQVDDLLLSSIVGDHRGSGTGLQNVYEDLIDRFRQAPDRRGRERVARRLIDDSRATDVEVRALAVWAMVKLEERGFRRALAKAANDENPEISKLALTGLERIGVTS